MSSKPDDKYRAFVGPTDSYDISGALQFNLLTALGLREDSTLLDVGCGSLRAGKLFIPYLRAGKYYGIEPQQWLIEKGLEAEIGQDIVRIKNPSFNNDPNFDFSAFRQSFDFILAQSIYSHAAQADIERSFSAAKDTLEPDGIFAATFMIGTENYSGKKWVYPGCVTYTADHIRKLAEDHELVATKLEWPHPNGQTWFALTHPEGAGSLPESLGHNERLRLEQRVKFLQKRIEKYQDHPYVKFGMRVNVLMQPIFSTIRRILGKAS